MNQFALIVAILLSVCSHLAFSKSAPTCTWDSKRGAHFDLRALTMASGSQTTYGIIDGDIPCTPEVEPSYGYAWNFCENVPKAAIPKQCTDMGKTGVILQWAQFTPNDEYCYILGYFDSNQHEITYDLLDNSNPSKGVTLRYPSGEKCSATNRKTRTATVEVECANVKSIVQTSQEPVVCEYHIRMKSWYGCPTECPVTGNGLCNSHGHCNFDPQAKKSYCYCNEGYSGSACDVKGSSSSSSSSYDGFSVQLGLMITLLLVALGLTGGVVYLAYKVGEFRKQQISSNYSSLPGESEMVETVHFK